MQRTGLFGHEQNSVWRGKSVDLICTGTNTFTEPCAETISSAGSTGLNGRCIKGSAAIFAGGVN